MKIISSRTVLFIQILNMCTGQNSTCSSDLNIIFNPTEITAVPGVCALISCNFTYPQAKSISKILLKEYSAATNKCDSVTFNGNVNEKGYLLRTETERIKMLEPDLTKNNCSFIMKDIKKHKATKQYAFVLEGKDLDQLTSTPSVQIIVQDKPKIEIPALSEGAEATLTCSTPFPCPETRPVIKWWILTREINLINLNDSNITLTTNESHYLSTLTLTPSSDLHDATIGCYVSYGRKTIRASRTLEVKYVQTKILGKTSLNEGEILNLSCSVDSHPPSTDPVWSFRGNTEKLHNQTSAGHLMIPNVGKEHAGTYTCEMTYMNQTLNASITIDVTDAATEVKANETSTNRSENMPNPTATGIEELLNKLDTSMMLTFVAGMAFSAFIFSMILCCWLSCHRGKKYKVPTSNPDTEINLETIQTDVAQTGTNEQTPLHDQPDDESPNPAAPTDGAEEEEVEEAGREVDYASIDYSLLKNRAPEEEKEAMDTEYAEIKKDNKKREAQQDGADPTPPDPEQTEGDEEIYSNPQMMNSQEMNESTHIISVSRMC